MISSLQAGPAPPPPPAPASAYNFRCGSDIGIDGVVAAKPVCPSIELVRGWIEKFKANLNSGGRAAIYGVLKTRCLISAAMRHNPPNNNLPNNKSATRT
jgi:hypothetical protein